MRYFNPHLTGSEKPPKPKRRLAAWSAASLIVAVLVLTAGNAGAQQSSTVDTAAATRHLFEAVHGNNMAAVQSSIAAGADISATNEWGVTAVDLAVDKGYFSIAHFLLSVRNLRQLGEKPKPSPIPPAASAATESRPVLPPVKPWAATVEPLPKVSRQTAPAGTEAPGDTQSQTAQAPAPYHIPSVAATTQSRTDGKPDPFDPSTAFPADDLPIIGKIRRRSEIPETMAPSPPPASKGFRPPTASRTEPAEGAAREASAPESAVPGASEAVKPSALSRFADTVSGFFRGKEEAGETAPAGGQPIPETETRADQSEPSAPAAAPEAASEEGENDIPAAATPATAEGEDTSRAGPASATPETPAPWASSEGSVAAPADEEPEEDFLLASISKRIMDLFSTKEEEETAAEEAAEETAFPSPTASRTEPAEGAAREASAP
ncbi:MAG: ankyrin repeat domain-containing protein, partial [Rhodospirillales bacterium]